ncbi:MAG: ATP-binding protein [Desulfovibrionaceae bacterium]|nr:ATP-binding protein [Desulfovibrionaceae bacterium]
MPEINLPISLDCIQPAIDFLNKHLGENHEDLGMYVGLAVEELLVNVVKHGQKKDSQPPSVAKIVLGCRWVNMDDSDQFSVWIKDWGKPFNPFANVKTPDITLGIEEREVGGLGVHLVKNVSTHYLYSISDGSNLIELYFQI